MIVKLWGTRGSLASPGPETERYGGNTSCVEVRGEDGTFLVLDAGTGIRRVDPHVDGGPRRVDVLLSHLHLDHLQGLGFFQPLFRSDVEVHVWGPATATRGLLRSLTRYLSPPLFPVHLKSLPCALELHEVPDGEIRIGGFRITAEFVCHPGPTVGYRIEENGATFTYLPDHEPALGVRDFPREPEWTSGYSLAAGVDLLVHDAQYDEEEYDAKVGWGHSTLEQAIAFAELCDVGRLVLFHHDPLHDDDTLERLVEDAIAAAGPSFPVVAGAEENEFRPGSG